MYLRSITCLRLRFPGGMRFKDRLTYLFCNGYLKAPHCSASLKESEVSSERTTPSLVVGKDSMERPVNR